MSLPADSPGQIKSRWVAAATVESQDHPVRVCSIDDLIEFARMLRPYGSEVDGSGESVSANVASIGRITRSTAGTRPADAQPL